jgi:hypothetical protein
LFIRSEVGRTIPSFKQNIAPINGSSPNFHKSVLSGSCTLESSKHPSSCLPRRLVCSKSKQTNVDGRSREDTWKYASFRSRERAQSPFWTK